MKELKRHKSIEEQVALMKSRGLIVQDEDSLKSSLANINYYRLSGYLHDFKKPDSDSYTENLTWERLKRIYDFDRKLSRILMFALEDIEETLKTRLSYMMTSRHPDDPLIYLKRAVYRNDEPYQKFLHYFEHEKYNNRKLPFVKHHFEEYNGQLPMWVAVELFTMGNLHGIYDNLIGTYQKQLAKTYSTGPVQLGNWIKNLAPDSVWPSIDYLKSIGALPISSDRDHVTAEYENLVKETVDEILQYLPSNDRLRK